VRVLPASQFLPSVIEAGRATSATSHPGELVMSARSQREATALLSIWPDQYRFAVLGPIGFSRQAVETETRCMIERSSEGFEGFLIESGCLRLLASCLSEIHPIPFRVHPTDAPARHWALPFTSCTVIAKFETVYGHGRTN